VDSNITYKAMTRSEFNAPELLDLLPLPEDALLLPTGNKASTPREMVLTAIKARLKTQKLEWRIGPTLDLANPERLLIMNGFSVQLVTSGFTADAIDVPLTHWRKAGAAPQILLAARVDEESQVVQIKGLLTGDEFQKWLKGQSLTKNLQSKDRVEIPYAVIKGGIERLLTLVQLLHPEAIGKKGLEARAVTPSILDWLSGQLDEALQAMGGCLVPATAGSFRSTANYSPNALAVLAIPLGLEDGQLCSGIEAENSVERFRLLLIPTGVNQEPKQLLVRLIPELEGDLLPEGLTLKVQQGAWLQTKTSQMDISLELNCSGSEEVLQVEINFPDSPPLELPPLQLAE
jgi:hypothetical protein